MSGALPLKYARRASRSVRFLVQRFPKAYRHPALDVRITLERLTAEARGMQRARRAGADAPLFFEVNTRAFWGSMHQRTKKDFKMMNEEAAQQLSRILGSTIVTGALGEAPPGSGPRIVMERVCGTTVRAFLSGPVAAIGGSRRYFARSSFRTRACICASARSSVCGPALHSLSSLLFDRRAAISSQIARCSRAILASQ